jgi:hypothetical protein
MAIWLLGEPKMTDNETSKDPSGKDPSGLPVTPRTLHKSDPEEKPDPEEDEDQRTTRPKKV